MSDDAAPRSLRGRVLWWTAEARGGAVETDDGDHYRFFQAEARPLRRDARVLVRIDPNPRHWRGGVIVQPMPGTDAAPPPAARSSRRRGPRRSSLASQTGKNEALTRGVPVTHPEFGTGFVVMSTSSLARVKFTNTGEERSVRVADLQRE